MPNSVLSPSHLRQLHETKFLKNPISEEQDSLPRYQALVAIKRSKRPLTNVSVRIERLLALDIQRVCLEGGLCDRVALTYLLSLWIGRLTYYSHSIEYLLDDAEFEDSDGVAIYFKPIDEPKEDLYVIHESIGWWLSWGEGRYLTQTYG